MPRGLDHIVHAARDLEALAESYRRLGFTVGARNRHPWGTHNHIVQLPGFFVELLTVAEPEGLGGEGIPRLFGAFNRDFLKSHEGLSMLILESRDAAGDARAFKDADIAASGALRFEREGRRPDGSAVKVAFSLAFARDPIAPDIGFAVCQQHHPENFWNPAFQSHPNSVSAIAGVVMVAENPTDHHIFISAFAGERELQSTSAGITVFTPRGEIQAMDASAYRNHFGVEPPEGESNPRLAAIRFVSRDLAAVRSILNGSGTAFAERMERIVIAPSVEMGACIVFEAPRS